MEAGKRNIVDVFNRARSLEIPFFQRAYVWDEDNWERFLNDMLEVARRGSSYFLGSVILKQRATQSGEVIGDIRVVVDGQQRLTTTVLFFKVLYDARGESDFRSTFFNLANEICLKHNHNDVEVFEAIVSGTLTPEIRKKYEQNQVLGAYDYFSNHSETLKSIQPPMLLSRIYFVGIDLGVDEDEQQIFDTINSLGVRLSTAELLKNEIFRRADLSLYESTWKKTFEADEDTRAYWGNQVTAGRTVRENIDLLLQSFLTIRSGAAEKYSGVDDLFASYRAFLHDEKPNKAELVHALQALARTYRDHVDPQDLDGDIDAKDAMARLNVIVFGLNTTTVVPYLLYVLTTVADVSNRARMLALVETFLVRRLICRETTKNYNNFFASLIRNRVDDYDALRKRLVDPDDGSPLIPSDAELADGFAHSKLTNSQARAVLYLLEKSIRDGKLYSTTPLGLWHYSLEHVMPKKWRNHWSSGLPATPGAGDERDRLVRRLGNLTLITSALNSTIRDADWSTKKHGNGKWHGLDKFAQGLEIFQQDLGQDTWDEARIRTRSARLLKHALTVWPLPAQ